MTYSWLGVPAIVFIACTGRGAGDSATVDTMSAATTQAAPEDSICGTVRVVGSEPDVMVQLELATGAREPLAGDPTRSLRLLSGLGVCVARRATATGERTVSGFVVRSHEGEPAVDGVLAERESVYLIRTTDGTEVRLPTVPDMLRGEVGNRVWVVLDGSGRVKSMGVIR